MTNDQDNKIITAIPFNNGEVTAIKQGDKVFVFPKEICKNLGIDWEGQRQRIERDTVLSSTTCIIKAVANDGKSREMSALPLEYLNGWLFGIDDKKVKPEITQI